MLPVGPPCCGRSSRPSAVTSWSRCSPTATCWATACELSFFDAPTRLPGGAAGAWACARARRCCPAFTVRTTDGRHLMLAGAAVALTRTATPAPTLQTNTARITRVLEAAIRRYPEQWTVFQPVWPR